MITADPLEGTMADVWVLSPSHSEPEKSRLIRSDAITYLSTSAEELVAARVGSDDTVVLVHRATQGGRDLPEDFHLAYLAKLAVARGRARVSEEDLVLLADTDDNGAWDWSVLPVSELWPG
ncbi:hypothetical protein [Streptomyces agglomeratus]|nr:hypothetical protein [Streptomyces agglomeratus]